MKLTRFAYFKDRTIGRLECDGKSWWTLERGWLANKTFVSCVPEGEYRLERYNSPKFGKQSWSLQGAPGRTFILFHAANRPSELEGCIALGNGLTANLLGITQSAAAIGEFYEATAGEAERLIRIVRGEAWVF